MIGVTGTSGKSTVVRLIVKILEESGAKVASLSSINFQIGDNKWENKLKMTMPGRFKIQRFIKRAVKNKCDYCVLEVTSEGIKQHRHKFISFNTAVFTNLSPEHIESHKGFENYRKAKIKLFRQTKETHILNLDDKNVGYFLKERAKKKYGYALENKDSKQASVLKASLLSSGEKGISFAVQGTEFNLGLIGEFNAYNGLAAIAVAVSEGIDLEKCRKALEKIEKMPGRMEVVAKEPFSVIIDYAHTPAALEKVYKNIKDGNRMICVLGACGGGRDKWKRPVFGKIASQYCDEIIITNEDPYDEDPQNIISNIKSGVSRKICLEILDRRKAIRKAISLAGPGDKVIITGKGSESWMCVANGRKIPWNDKKIAEEAL